MLTERLVAVAVCLLCVLFVTRAGAEPVVGTPSPEAQAREHFQRGVDALGRGELARAAEQFEAAQALSPNPIVLYNLGQTYSALGLPVQAERALRAYLNGEPPPSDPDRIREVESLIAFNDRRIGTVVVTAMPPDAVLELDGSRVELDSEGGLRLAVGRHVLVATSPTLPPRVVNVDVTPGAEVRVSLASEPPPVESPPAPAVLAQPAVAPSTPAPVNEPVGGKNTNDGSRTARAIGIAAMSVGAAAVIAGSVLGVQAIHENNHSYDGGHCDQKTCDSVGMPIREAAVRHGNWSTALFVTGVAAAGVGIALYFFVGSESHAHQARSTTLGVSARATGTQGALLTAELGF
jgi:hypothetical protein